MKYLPLLLVVSSLYSLEEKPWFCDLLEFQGLISYEYSFYSKVDNAVHPLKHTSHDNLITLGLSTRMPEDWQWQAELELAQTPRFSFGCRSFALEARYSLFDDVMGDALSLVVGGTFRHVTPRAMKDISTPYHGPFAGEVNLALGKEWCCGPSWTHRLFALGAFGDATRGKPWLRGDLFYMGNFCDRHQWRIFGLTYFGTGHHDRVNINHFHGWGQIDHRSIDLGIGYRYLFDYYGSLFFDYKRRVYAHSYPEQVNFFIISYEIPFSCF